MSNTDSMARSSSTVPSSHRSGLNTDEHDRREIVFYGRDILESIRIGWKAAKCLAVGDVGDGIEGEELDFASKVERLGVSRRREIAAPYEVDESQNVAVNLVLEGVHIPTGILGSSDMAQTIPCSQDERDLEQSDYRC
ncbi:unnamed protein product [Parascedosporium putredinis]|uniref:Uncharacterized protein n=1 Tax=Parascedosporium putredinis TaxID=1442378 RepID=A0A9P1MCF2_9PEZI|nr:unnamed protein product [Parascedosporium putredinis]CAI7996429.1 unnamed protein product [Parascedosporium putredinis]